MARLSFSRHDGDAPAAAETPLPHIADTPEGAEYAARLRKLFNLETAYEKGIVDGMRLPQVGGSALLTRAKRGDPPRDPVSPAARAALGEFAPAAPEQEPPADLAREAASKLLDPNAQALADHSVRMNGLVQAMDVLRAQLAPAHAKASRAYCAEYAADRYRAVAADLCAKLIAVADSIQVHQRFLDDLVQLGVQTAFLPPLGAGAYGVGALLATVADQDSPIRQVLRTAQEAGHYDAREAIKRWQQPVPTRDDLDPFEAERGQLAYATRLHTEATEEKTHVRMRYNPRSRTYERLSGRDARLARMNDRLAAEGRKPAQPLSRDELAARLNAAYIADE